MTPAHITRLMTFAATGQPKEYAASDMMRADLEALITQAARVPMTDERISLVCPYISKSANADFSKGVKAAEAHHGIGVKP